MQSQIQDCISRPRTIPAIGGAVTVLLGLDSVLPYSPAVHHMLGGLIAEYVWGRGVPMVLSTGPPYVDTTAAIDVACTALTGYAGGWIANRPEVAGIRNMVPKLA